MLRLDTIQAERDLARFQGKLGGATVAVGAGLGGAVARAAPAGPPGGVGRGGGGIGFGGIVGAGAVAAVGAEFAAPILGDLHKIASGILGGLGISVSTYAGLSGEARNAQVETTARAKTVELMGLAGGGASKEQNQAVYDMIHSMEQMRANAANKVESDVNDKYQKQVLEKANGLMDKIGDWIVAHPAINKAVISVFGTGGR